MDPSRDIFAKDVSWPTLSKYIVTEQRILKNNFPNTKDYWIPILAPFEIEIPQKYYTEETFKIVFNILEKSFKKDLQYFEKALIHFGNKIDAAYASHKRITNALLYLHKKEKNIEVKYRQKILPVYLELIEAVWKPLTQFFILALEKPKESDFYKYSELKIKNLEDKISGKKIRNIELLIGFDRELRNNIAHQTFEFSDHVAKKILLFYVIQKKEIFLLAK